MESILACGIEGIVNPLWGEPGAAYQILEVMAGLDDMEDMSEDGLPDWADEGRARLAKMAESWLDGLERKAAIQQDADRGAPRPSPAMS